MPVVSGGQEYTPFSKRVKRVLGRGGRDIQLPAEKDGKAVVKAGSLDQFRQAGKGLKQLRELTSKSRSQSKR